MARSTIAPTQRVVPTQIQQGPVGTVNPAVVTGRSIPLFAIASKGPSQRRERFSGIGLPPNLARGLNAQQDWIAAALAVLEALPWANGLSITQGVKFTGGATTTVQHRLGRPPQGYMIVNQTGALSTFFRTLQATPQLESVQILIVAQNTFTGDVWVW